MTPDLGHRRVFPETYAKPITPRYQRVAQTTVWLTVWPQTEKSRDFCCSTRLSNGLAWQQDQATALSVGFWADSLMTPHWRCWRSAAIPALPEPPARSNGARIQRLPKATPIESSRGPRRSSLRNWSASMGLRSETRATIGETKPQKHEDPPSEGGPVSPGKRGKIRAVAGRILPQNEVRRKPSFERTALLCLKPTSLLAALNGRAAGAGKRRSGPLRPRRRRRPQNQPRGRGGVPLIGGLAIPPGAARSLQSQIPATLAAKPHTYRSVVNMPASR